MLPRLTPFGWVGREARVGRGLMRRCGLSLLVTDSGWEKPLKGGRDTLGRELVMRIWGVV